MLFFFKMFWTIFLLIHVNIFQVLCWNFLISQVSKMWFFSNGCRPWNSSMLRWVDTPTSPTWKLKERQKFIRNLWQSIFIRIKRQKQVSTLTISSNPLVYLERARILRRFRFSLRIRFLRHCNEKTQKLSLFHLKSFNFNVSGSLTRKILCQIHLYICRNGAATCETYLSVFIEN